MKNNYLLSFGDSWACCVEGKSYASHLASTSGYHLLDYGVPSTSVAHMILQFQKFVKTEYQSHNTYKAIFFITAQERQLTFDDNNNPIEIHPSNDNFKHYYQNIYVDRLGEFNLNLNILALQYLCNHYQINDFYLLGWQYPQLWPEINHEKFYKKATLNCMSMLDGIDKYRLGVENNENFIANDGHPSVIGHKKIADALYPWIFEHTTLL